MAVKARFYVSEIKKTPTDYLGVVLQPVIRATPLPGAESNKSWSKYTPSGRIEMNVSNATGAAQWFDDHLGKDVSITFDEVED